MQSELEPSEPFAACLAFRRTRPWRLQPRCPRLRLAIIEREWTGNSSQGSPLSMSLVPSNSPPTPEPLQPHFLSLTISAHAPSPVGLTFSALRSPRFPLSLCFSPSSPSLSPLPPPPPSASLHIFPFPSAPPLLDLPSALPSFQTSPPPIPSLPSSLRALQIPTPFFFIPPLPPTIRSPSENLCLPGRGGAAPCPGAPGLHR